MAQTGELSIADVRLAMNDVSATEFPDDVIEAELEAAEAIITHHLDAEAFAALDQQIYNLSATALAKWRVWMSSPQEMRRGALDLNITYDVQTYTNRLREEKNEALARIGVATGGSSAGIAGKTDGVWDHNRYADSG